MKKHATKPNVEKSRLSGEFLQRLTANSRFRRTSSPNDDYNVELQGQQGADIYRAMRLSDPLIGAFFRTVKSIIANTEFYIESDEPSTLWDGTGLNNFISNIFDAAATYGTAYIEIVVQKDRHAGLWKPVPVVIPNHTIMQYHRDELGNLTGITQSTAYGIVEVPREKLILVSLDGTSEGTGYSVLRNCYRSWYYYTNLESLQAVLIERDAVGLPLITVPPRYLTGEATASEQEAVESILQQAADFKADESSYIVLPAAEYTDAVGRVQKTGWSFEPIRSGGSRSLNIDSAIASHKKDLTVSLLSEFLMLGGGGGSYALSETQSSLFLTVLNGFIKSIVAQLNVYNSWLNDLNALPESRIEFDTSKLPDLQEVSNYVTQLVNANVLTRGEKLEEFLREVGNLPSEESGADEVIDSATEDKE
jgi:hypothetical protein